MKLWAKGWKIVSGRAKKLRYLIEKVGEVARRIVMGLIICILKVVKQLLVMGGDMTTENIAATNTKEWRLPCSCRKKKADELNQKLDELIDEAKRSKTWSWDVEINVRKITEIKEQMLLEYKKKYDQHACRTVLVKNFIAKLLVDKFNLSSERYSDLIRDDQEDDYHLCVDMTSEEMYPEDE